jgi:hypothetical protein
MTRNRYARIVFAALLIAGCTAAPAHPPRVSQLKTCPGGKIIRKNLPCPSPKPTPTPTPVPIPTPVPVPVPVPVPTPPPVHNPPPPVPEPVPVPLPPPTPTPAELTIGGNAQAILACQSIMNPNDSLVIDGIYRVEGFAALIPEYMTGTPSSARDIVILSQASTRHWGDGYFAFYVPIGCVQGIA